MVNIFHNILKYVNVFHCFFSRIKAYALTIMQKVTFGMQIFLNMFTDGSYGDLMETIDVDTSQFILR